MSKSDFSDFINGIREGVITPVGAQISTLESQLDQLQSALDILSSEIERVDAEVDLAISLAIGQIAEASDASFSPVEETLDIARNAVNAFQQIVAPNDDWGEEIVVAHSNLMGVLEAASDAIRSGTSDLVSEIDALTDESTEKFESWLQSYRSGSEDLSEVYTQTNDTLSASIPDVGQAISAELEAGVLKPFLELADSTEAAIDKVDDAISAVTDDIVGELTQVTDKISQIQDILEPAATVLEPLGSVV